VVVTASPSAPAAPVFGPGPATLVVDGSPVAAVAVARTRTERRTGLLGSSGVDGALWLTRCGAVHTVGMTYPLEVAFLDRRGRCTAVRTRPHAAKLPTSASTVERARRRGRDQRPGGMVRTA